jgi:hypothetical protein
MPLTMERIFRDCPNRPRASITSTSRASTSKSIYNMGKATEISRMDSFTSTIFTETLDSVCLDSSGLPPSQLSNGFKNSSNKKCSKYIVGKSSSKVTKYLLLRSPASFSKDLDAESRSYSGSTSEPVDSMTIDDRFYRDFNRCTPPMLDFLRRQRSIESPIMCYESDDILDSRGPRSNFFLRGRDIKTPFLSVGNFDLQKGFIGAKCPESLLLRQRIDRSDCKNHEVSQISQHIIAYDILLMDTQFSNFRVCSCSDELHYLND